MGEHTKLPWEIRQPEFDREGWVRDANSALVFMTHSKDLAALIIGAVNSRAGEMTMDWRPIDSAPRDRFVLLYVPDGQIETGPVTIGRYWTALDRAENGRFQKGHWVPADWRGWLGMDADHSASWCNPTYWMPLPEPPQF